MTAQLELQNLMQAVVIHQHGGLSELSFEQVPLPVVGSGEVLVQLKATALNHLDLWVRQGWPGLKVQMPHILIQQNIHIGSTVNLTENFNCHIVRHFFPVNMKVDLDELYARADIITIDGPSGAATILKLHPSTLRFRIKKLGIRRPV